MRRLTLAMWIVTAALCCAAPPTLDIPAVVLPTGQYAIVNPKTDAVSVVYVGLDGISPIPYAQLGIKTNAFCLDVWGKPEKGYRFVAVAASASGEQTMTPFTVQVGKTPVPPAPDPPGPTPPVPPAPTPTAPFAANGLHVLIVRETGDSAKLPGPQLSVFTAKPLRDWLKAHCADDKDYGKAFLIIDQNDDLSQLDPVWAAARKCAEGKPLPFIAASDGKVGTAEPLPKDTAATLELLAKFWGK